MRQGLLGGWTKVFRFTLARTAGTRGWRILTILPALLLLLIIPALLLAFGGEDRETEDPAAPAETALRTVYAADELPGRSEPELLNGLGDERFDGLRYVSCADRQEALDRAAKEPESALALFLWMEDDCCRLLVVQPEGSTLGEDAEAYADFLNGSFGQLLPRRSGLDEDTLEELSVPVTASAEDAEALLSGEESDPTAEVRDLISTFLPYLNVMVLYFLVLFYGQNVASHVVLEKQNKLMDSFLLALRPEAMVLGKLLAGALAGILQALAWILGAVGGLLAASLLMDAVHPGSQLPFLLVIRQLGSAGLFPPGPSVLALLLIIGGFLLYCSLAAVGGAMAGKQADLGSTNSLFSILLVASFLISILGKGSSSHQLISDASWMGLVPFTAVLTLPSRLALGEASLLTGFIALALTLLCTLLFALAAGRLYALLAFRRGDPPKLGDIPKLLKGK